MKRVEQSITQQYSGADANEQQDSYPRIKQLSSLAPCAQQIPFTAEYHGKKYSDPYHWVKDPGYPEVNDPSVLKYLNAENAYFDIFKTSHEPLINTVFEEFKGRVDGADTSVPWQKGGDEYRWEFGEGADYRTWFIRPLDGGKEDVLLDEPSLAQGQDYFVLGDLVLSPDKRYLAYTVDTSGDERYQLYVKDRVTGELTEDVIDNVSSDVDFSPKTNTLFYGELALDRWKVSHIKSHIIGQPVTRDATLATEEDDGFFLGFNVTTSEQFLMITSSQAERIEVQAVHLNHLERKPLMIIPRDQGVVASVDHAYDKFYICVNDLHVNGRLVQVSDQDPSYENWTTLIEGSDHIYIQHFQTFKDFIAIKQGHLGEEQIRIRYYNGQEHYIKFPERVFTVEIGNNPEFDQKHIRLCYESMITPLTVYDYNLSSSDLVTKKVQVIPSGYDKSQYKTERLMATARDGAQVPVSIVYSKEFKRDGSHPVHLLGYGAYGFWNTPNFETTYFSLLDRGFAVAIAHIRGGEEMGYQWYLDGKLQKRQNTFNDFIDVGTFLVDQGYASKGNISISGRSAGGALMGAVVTQAPGLWRSVILGVPFVDILNTMLDASLPLTPPEWREWGNPIISKEDFETIRAYSPYDNISSCDYPPMLVTGGLYDPRVTYWEPAKWTARMRSTKTDDNLLLMRMNMSAGHFSNSGRYGRLKDIAEEYAFILASHGILQ